MNGQLERDGDRWRLRFTRELAHPAQAVWQAIVDPDRRRAWFPDTAVGDFEQVGGTLRFEHAGGAIEPQAATIGPPEGWDG